MRSKHAAFFCIVLLSTFAWPVAAQQVAHDDDQFDQDRQPPYDGPGYRAMDGGQPPIEFPAQDVELLSWVPIVELDPAATSADDCWGYVSPSGREYAIIGISTGTAFVEVTDPMDAQHIASIAGPNSIWRDIKVYQHYAYAVSEGGGGIQVMDLSDIDNGVVTLVNTVTTGGRLSTHNVAINEESGFLYRAGGGGSNPVMGLRIYDLSDPVNPFFAGEWNERYCHDAQVVNWTEGAYAGREIAFCYANDTSGGGNPGIDILDVTDKSDIVLIHSVSYSDARFSHQGWLSPDRRYIYLDDELDEVSLGRTTTTRVIEVNDLQDAVEAATFTNGRTAIDHNLYTRGNLIFAANYRSGLRIFDATDPIAPVEIAFFDTYPENDSPNFNGLWNNFPYFPSGTVIGSDIEKGLFVWGVPALADCNGNGILDLCDISCDPPGGPCGLDGCGLSDDCNNNNIPDECEPDEDCNNTGVRDICEVALGLSPDCNDNEIPDDCDIAGGFSNDLDGDGIPDECCVVAAPPQAGLVSTTNRYLSVALPQIQQQAAVRITLVELPAPFQGHEGTQMWVGSPFAVSDRANFSDATPPTFLAAGLECEPTLLDWSAIDEVQVFGAAIVPGATYRVEALGEACLTVGVESFSEALTITTSKWGDVVGDCQSIPCSPPDSIITVTADLFAMIDKFLGKPGAPSKSRVDLGPNEPDHTVSISDVVLGVDAIRGVPYPFPGPEGCP